MTQQELQDKTNAFFDEWNGKACNPDGAYGNQCVDVADQFSTEVVGIPLPPVNGAKDFWNKNLIGYDKIPNTPTGVPVIGDVIIWGWGAFGHVAIFKEGDENKFTSFDQDFPTQGYYDSAGNFIGTGVCHFQDHNNYDGVLGWFHPQIQEPAITPPVLQGLAVQVGYNPSFLGQTVSVNGVTYESTSTDNVLTWQVVPPPIVTPPETPPEGAGTIISSNTEGGQVVTIPVESPSETTTVSTLGDIPITPPVPEKITQNKDNQNAISHLLSVLWIWLKKLIS